MFTQVDTDDTDDTDDVVENTKKDEEIYTNWTTIIRAVTDLDCFSEGR